MPEIYAEIEERISQAIVAIDTYENASRSNIAQEFRVPIQRLRSRLNGHPPANSARGGAWKKTCAWSGESFA